MFEISTETYFSAAHHLENYKGSCENVHGHNWRVIAHVKSDRLNDIGIAIDFKELKSILSEIIGELDHSDLNTIFTKKSQNPSSENIAQYIYTKFKQALNIPGCSVSRIDVYETPGNCASYFEDD